MAFGTLEQAIADIRAGKFIVVADAEDRAYEGDLICGAQAVTPDMVNFMIRKAGGMNCLALTGERVEQHKLPLMSEENSEAMRTAFTVTIDASPRFGVTTGISASDRAQTIHARHRRRLDVRVRRMNERDALRTRDRRQSERERLGTRSLPESGRGAESVRDRNERYARSCRRKLESP